MSLFDDDYDEDGEDWLSRCENVPEDEATFGLPHELSWGQDPDDADCVDRWQSIVDWEQEAGCEEEGIVDWEEAGYFIEETCIECDGSGKIPWHGQMVTCANCNGHGVTEVEDERTEDEESEEDRD